MRDTWSSTAPHAWATGCSLTPAWPHKMEQFWAPLCDASTPPTRAAGGAQTLCVLGCEVGGRWNADAGASLPSARTQPGTAGCASPCESSIGPLGACFRRGRPTSRWPHSARACTGHAGTGAYRCAGPGRGLGLGRPGRAEPCCCDESGLTRDRLFLDCLEPDSGLAEGCRRKLLFGLGPGRLGWASNSAPVKPRGLRETLREAGLLWRCSFLPAGRSRPPGPTPAAVHVQDDQGRMHGRHGGNLR